jgi:hypothetical protein
MKFSRTASLFALTFLNAHHLVSSFSQGPLRNAKNVPSSGSLSPSAFLRQKTLFMYEKDTLAELPSFETKDEYEKYLMEASGLPKGFATGSANGEFIPVESPAMGSLPIKGTVIYVTDGPSDNWAAVFTKNKVSIFAAWKYSIRSFKIPFLILSIP